MDLNVVEATEVKSVCAGWRDRVIWTVKVRTLKAFHSVGVNGSGLRLAAFSQLLLPFCIDSISPSVQLDPFASNKNTRWQNSFF